MWRSLCYRSYRQLFGAAVGLSRRLTPAGKFALACLILAAALGLDTTQTTAYQAFTFLTALFIAARLGSLSWRRDRALSFRRELPRYGTAGTPVEYRITATNGTRQAQHGVVLMEDLGDPRPTAAEFAARPRRPPRTLADRLDTWLGYSRWQNLVAARQVAVIPDQPLPPVPPNGTATARISFTPRRRGRLHFAGLIVARADPLGLVNRPQRLPLPQSLVILPRRYVLPPLPLPGSHQYQHGGVALASSVGQSDEFVALREYRPGDPWRYIHWPSVAKTDRLIVREHEDEFFVRHALVLDTFGDPDRVEPFEAAVSLAASFVYTVQTQESLLDLLFVGPEAYCFTAGRGVGHVDRLLEVLAGVQPASEPAFGDLESLVARHAGQVCGCVCVFLAWDEPRRRLVRLLRSRRVPVHVCVVTADGDPAPVVPASGPDAPDHFRHLRAGTMQEDLLRP